MDDAVLNDAREKSGMYACGGRAAGRGRGRTSRLRRAAGRCVVPAAAVLLVLGGCGGSEDADEEEAETGPPPPVAVRQVRFGSTPKRVQKQFKTLEEMTDAHGLEVYTHRPDQDEGVILYYTFEFVDDQLALVRVSYHADRFDEKVEREAFFDRIQRKYNVKSDLGMKRGMWRWISINRELTVTWEENAQRDIHVLSVSWDVLEEVRRARHAAIRRDRTRERERSSGSDSVDLGI